MYAPVVTGLMHSTSEDRWGLTGYHASVSI